MGAYFGVRSDYNLVMHEGMPGFIIDFPFSFVADTLLMPVDLWPGPSTTDPLVGWREVCPIGCKSGYMKADIETIPAFQAITDDVEVFVNKLPVWRDYHIDEPVGHGPVDERRYCYWINRITLYEDGNGKHAVKIEIPVKGTYWNYVLIYDKSNVRIKKTKFAGGYYRS